MKKKYSDPLMFSAALLTTIPIKTSVDGSSGPDTDLDSDPTLNGLNINASPVRQGTDPVTIVNPVEEPVNSTDAVPEKAPGTAKRPSSMEVESVIDEIVPEETTSSATTSGE